MRSFESEKFINVTEFLENLDELAKPQNMQELIWMKFKNNLLPYKSEIVKLRNFGNKKVYISGKDYDLKVYILKENDNFEYVTTIPMKFK